MRRLLDHVNAHAIARVCHEANRAYCATQGDLTQPSWDDAPDWQRTSAVLGVEGIVAGGVTRPEQSHEGWMSQKLAEGWKLGPTKDPVKKEHPCLVPYAELPESQRTKDALFFGVVMSLTEAAE